jgi:hypothetical protein
MAASLLYVGRMEVVVVPGPYFWRWRIVSSSGAIIEQSAGEYGTRAIALEAGRQRAQALMLTTARRTGPEGNEQRAT